MALLSRQAASTSEVEGQTVTNWRLIWITSALELFFLVGLMVTCRLLPGSEPRPAAAPMQPDVTRIAVKPRAAPIASQAAHLPEPGKTKSEDLPPIAKPGATKEQPRVVATAPRPFLAPPAAQSSNIAKAAPKTAKQTTAISSESNATRRPTAPAVRQARVAAPAPPPQPDPPPFKRCDHRLEVGLAELLRHDVPEFDLDSVKGTSAKLLAQAKPGAVPANVRTVLDLMPQRIDLNALPFRKGAECKTDKKTAQQLQAISIALRRLVLSERKDLPSTHQSPAIRMMYFQAEGRAKDGVAYEDVEVSALVQLLQAEEEPVRLTLVHLLAPTRTRLATAVLAQRALFDLSELVREEAVRALKGRAPGEVRKLFMDGMRYPWFPVADHAAEALVALQDKEAVSGLVALLDQPDPKSPVQRADKKWVVPELVRINHLRNCLLCHPPSSAETDLVRAPVPKPDEPLSTQSHYGELRGDAIRADITYLRQDFSVFQPVLNPGKWPEKQRYDYFVRKRELSDDEVKRFQATIKSAPHTAPSRTYPQREAVLFALRELSGKDVGDSSEAWSKWFARKGP